MSKRFLVYLCDSTGTPMILEHEYETVRQARAHPWRRGRIYKILVDGKLYLTPEEFDVWELKQT